MKKGIRLFTYDGLFFTYTGKIFDLLLVSILWVIGCLPVVTVGASCCALFETVSKAITQDRGTPAATFFKAYRRDLKAGCLAWAVYGGAIGLLLLNLGILHRFGSGNLQIFLLVFYSLCIAFLVCGMLYVFPIISRFSMPFGWYLKLSLFCVVRYFPISLFFLALFVLGYLAVLYMPGLIVVIPGMICLMSSFMTETILKRHMPLTEGEEKEDMKND